MITADDQSADIEAKVLTIVTPVFNEADTLMEFAERLYSQLTNLKYSYEVIFINDGSTDNSQQILETITKQYPNTIVIELSRNFGHQYAISAGIDYANSEVVIIMDSDLQDPPELIPQFINAWEDGHDIIYGIRKTRQENFFKKFCYAIFYRTLRLLSNIDIPLDAGDFCLISQKPLAELKKFPERNRFLRGLRSWVGFKQTGIEYDRDKRYAGKPKYTIRRLITLAFDGLLSFSYRPLRFISLVGILISISSFLLALYYSIKRVQFGLTPPGFATTVVAIFFFSGIQLTFLGIIGEYLARIYEEVKQRPLYITRTVSRSDS